jgi:hypothetical protein
MSTMVVLVGLFVFAGCSTMQNPPASDMPDDQPVGTSGTSSSVPNQPVEVASSEPGVIPVGQEIDVRLQTPLSSKTATTEQHFESTTLVDVRQDGDVLIPAGSAVRGVVRSVDSAGNIDRSGRLTLAFDRITVRGRDYPIKGLATQAFESRGIRDEVGTVGTAGAVGAIVGGIIGGLRGAIIGAAVGSGGVIAATEGSDVSLPAGTIIRVRLDTPVEVL